MPRKGQTLSKESIQKKNDTNRKNLLEKYDWSLVEDYLDVNLSSSSRGRQRHFITLGQFKALLLSGMSVREIHKITSKNLTGFFSAFCQGKIQLPKDVFTAEYKNGKSMEQIAKEHDVSSDYIGFLRQLYEIKTKGAKFIKRKQTEIPLTQRQKKIIYGSFMGDAGKMSPSSVRFKHGEKQKEYLLWKYKEIESIMSPHSLQEYEKLDKRSGNMHRGMVCYTYANSDLEEIIERFYGNGEKDITEEILNEMTPLSIAVWFMDDGATDWGHRSIVKHPTWNITPESSFCTDSFSKESCDLIVKWFEEKWHIKSHTRERGKTKRGNMKYRVIIDCVSSSDFFNLIRPHILPIFLYKIDYEAYNGWRENDF